MSNEELQKAIDDITKENTDSTAIAPAVPTEEAPEVAAPADAMPAEAMPPAETPAAPEAAEAAPASVDPIAPPPAAPEVPPMPADASLPDATAEAPAADVAPVAEAAESAEATTAPELTPSADLTADAAAPEATAEEPAAEASAQPDLGEGVTIGADGLIDVNPVEAAEKMTNIPTEEPAANLIKVKQDTLRELFPLMDKLNIDPVEKFGIYKDIIDLTKDHSAIEAAHETVSQITDEQTRADALLELLEIIATFQV